MPANGDCRGRPAPSRLPKRSLSAHEAAVVLELPVRTVRNMQRRGELRDVRPGRLRGIPVGQLAALVAGRPLAGAVLDAIATGRLIVGILPLDAQPRSLIESWDRIK